MRLALDTNRYTDLMNGVAEVVSRLEAATSIYVPLPVIAELRAGFTLGAKGRANELMLNKFLARNDVAILMPDLDTTRYYAEIYGQLRRQGTPIPVNDIWIAALVMQHGVTLYARDAHFDHLPQIVRA